jgi:hypothetical protein
LGAEGIGNVLGRADEEGGGREGVRDGERGEKLRLGKVRAGRLGDDGGEVLLERGGDVGEELEEGMVGAGPYALGEDCPRRRIEVRGGSLRNPETGG